MKQSAFDMHRAARNPCWVVGAVHRRTTPQSKPIKMEIVSDRSGATMTTFAQKHVNPGSQANTDGWAGYNFLPSINTGQDAATNFPMRLTRQIVNHSTELVTPEGLHINNIEISWSAFKRRTALCMEPPEI
eukprot:Plantae.Rhodophyta-Palmaria_palmata.ctg14898.p1 GENE.Plantae.Rhodophyta-Palmaria_palmata.ctg14898~~Plantae.Rhodophyta-Palmaria_palmata.ctg14898.p1  ORF type:complete len:131 (-),score=8.66 Plantae.Rhodophyta-Palmaria_palmata.ctg14898:201-593(-)